MDSRNGKVFFTIDGSNYVDSASGWQAQTSDRLRYDVGAATVVHTTIPSLTFADMIGTRPISFGQDPQGRRLVSYNCPAAGKFLRCRRAAVARRPLDAPASSFSNARPDGFSSAACR